MLVPRLSGRSQRIKVIVQVEAVGIIAVFIGRDRSDVVSEILSVPQRRMMLFLGEKQPFVLSDCQNLRFVVDL